MIKRASLLRLKNCIGTNLFCLANFNEDFPRNKISDLVYRENLSADVAMARQLNGTVITLGLLFLSRVKWSEMDLLLARR